MFRSIETGKDPHENTFIFLLTDTYRDDDQLTQVD